MTPEAAGRLWKHTRGNPLHARAVLRELPEDAGWQHEHRTLPVPKSYAQLVRERLDRCPAHVVNLVEAAAVLGVRAPVHAVVELASVERPLEMLDDAIESGLVRLDDRGTGRFVEFSHPLARAAIYDALPTARRCALNAAAAQIVGDRAASMRHRVEAATVLDGALLDDLEAHAHSEMSRGAWSSAVSSLIAASRLSPVPADRERLALEAIEATMYSGDGAAARRLADQTGFADGPGVTASWPTWRCSRAISRRRSECSGARGTGGTSPTTIASPRRSPSAAPSSRRRACGDARRSNGPSARWRLRPRTRPTACSSLHRWRWG
jgi:hypothetical protein